MKVRIRISRKDEKRIEICSKCLRYPSKSGVRFGKGKSAEPAPKVEVKKGDSK